MIKENRSIAVAFEARTDGGCPLPIKCISLNDVSRFGTRKTCERGCAVHIFPAKYVCDACVKLHEKWGKNK